MAHPCYRGFRTRAAELIDIANTVFPCKSKAWDFFGANHDMTRVFRLDQDTDTKEQKQVPNPWKPVCPTFLGSSTIVARCLGADNSVFIKRLHGLEAMRFMGWDLGMYKNDTAFTSGVTPELLSNMAGNAWCQWHFIPLMLACGGSIDWSKAKQDLQKVHGPGFPQGNINWLPSRNVFRELKEASDDAASSSDDSD